MGIQSLNGWWDYRIGGGAYTKKKVPYSALPVGRSECALTFDRTERTGRAFLFFEGITYSAAVTFNGAVLGEILPYCRYKFEITDLLRDAGNTLTVTLDDIDPPFGPSEGWENYGGIIRDVYIEYTGQNIIADTTWSAQLNSGYTNASCAVRVAADARDDGLQAAVMLTDSFGRTAYQGWAPVSAGQAEVSFKIPDPLLWSPDSPYLYTLETSLVKGQETVYTTTEKVGFKDFTAKGRRFYLNGAPLFLLGVCRHDLFGDDGHTLIEEQMVRDMKMIKDAGVNYVRLVHYPHHKRILELADELGLLVSGEPGLWWSDMSNPEICECSLKVLEKTIQRDKNHVSVAFWLCFNECIFTPEFLRDSADTCRAADSTRMVSGANCMDLEMTKKYFNECGFDFYTMHPYAPTPEWMLKCAEALDDKPLLLSEWGGYFVYENESSLREFIQTIISLWKNDESKPVVAGASLWYWAEMYEFHRGGRACVDGVLREGLVDMYRNPLVNLPIFKDEFAALYREESAVHKLEVTGYIFENTDYTPVDLSNVLSPADRTATWEAMVARSKEPIARFHHESKRTRKMDNGPALPEEIKNISALPVALEQKPLVIASGKKITVPIGKAASNIYFIGNVSMPKGYPTGGEYGEEAGAYTVVYTDGTRQTTALRNGADLTTAAAFYGPSRIDPAAENARRILKYTYDLNWEHYVVNLFRLPADKIKTIERIEIEGRGDGYYLLLYGLTVQP